MAMLVFVGLVLAAGFEDARVLSESFKISVEETVVSCSRSSDDCTTTTVVHYVVATDPRKWEAKRAATRAKANSIAFKLVLGTSEQAAEFAFEGPKENCIIWQVGENEAKKLALNSFAWGTFALNTPMSLWNEVPAAEVEAHSRFAIEADGRISPNVTVGYAKGIARLDGRFVLGVVHNRRSLTDVVLNRPAGGTVALVNRVVPLGVTDPPLFFKANI